MSALFGVFLATAVRSSNVATLSTQLFAGEVTLQLAAESRALGHATGRTLLGAVRTTLIAPFCEPTVSTIGCHRNHLGSMAVMVVASMLIFTVTVGIVVMAFMLVMTIAVLGLCTLVAVACCVCRSTRIGTTPSNKREQHDNCAQFFHRKFS
jgi:hypothetical protein